MKERDSGTLRIPNGLWEAAGLIEDSTPTRFVIVTQASPSVPADSDSQFWVFSASASGRATASLSSLAWLMNTSAITFPFALSITNIGGLKLSRFLEQENGQNVRPHRSRIPPRQVFSGPGPNRKTWEKSKLRPTNVSARRSRTKVLPRACYETRTHPHSDILAPHHLADQGARPEMIWKHRTPEQWMRIGFTVLVLVGVICTLLIVVARLR